jgi:hypothetical protein
MYTNKKTKRDVASFVDFGSNISDTTILTATRADVNINNNAWATATAIRAADPIIPQLVISSVAELRLSGRYRINSHGHEFVISDPIITGIGDD